MTFGTTKGPHTFSVQGTDRNGNVGEWKRYTFDVGKENIYKHMHIQVVKILIGFCRSLYYPNYLMLTLTTLFVQSAEQALFISQIEDSILTATIV